ncbi:hypothetical protein DY000_02025143 [Brassica cretica]|uniref:Uncharacterized protein n=1 Tax=Brassica cretica TaxID=69181 RepID=A0ABQ7EB19_BRACR|nr:hypothetical protein DY000_02025143 [Brassica cretica]
MGKLTSALNPKTLTATTIRRSPSSQRTQRKQRSRRNRISSAAEHSSEPNPSPGLQACRKGTLWTEWQQEKNKELRDWEPPAPARTRTRLRTPRKASIAFRAEREKVGEEREFPDTLFFIV